MKQKLLIAISCLVVLTGCSDDSLLKDIKKQKIEDERQWEECVKNYLKKTDFYDPNTAEEAQELLKYDAWNACGWGNNN